MDEKTLLTWTVKRKSLYNFTSRKSLLIILILFLLALFWLYFHNGQQFSKEVVVYLVIFSVLILLAFFSQKNLEFRITNKAIYKKRAGSTFLGFYQEYSKAVSDVTGGKVSNFFYLPYKSAKYFKVVAGEIIVVRKMTGFSSGITDLVIVPSNNLPEI
ncbi:hypothetical protein HY450_03070, partial [Candidatus Pacearchaeota archaeon]|nr:hypothetical protein [Candidatus Pacearchaeota archaeon]